MALIEDDFIMTIGDDDEVPDLEAVANDAPPPQNKRKLNGKQKGGKKAKPQETKDEGDMTKGFLVDLETDGLDAVPQTLDFTLARASLKKRRNPGMYSTLDEKIALSRRAAKIARLAALDKPDEMEVSEEEEVVESVSDNNDEDVESASDGEEEKGGSDEEEEDASDDDEENSMVDAPVLEDESGSEVESDEEEESESEVDSESEESEDDGGSSEEESEVDEIEEARKLAYFAKPEEGSAPDIPESFTTMNLSRQIMKGLTKLGFAQPTPIQARTIPLALLGKDICGGAQTGSGKTAAFLVPILERLLYRPKNTTVTRVLILCPTRELAIQCHNVSTKLAGFTDISTCLCVGGLSLKQQESELKLRPDVVIATPGRLIDHLRNSQSFHLDQIEILVMDEADRMLDDGFEDELTEIIKACPQKRQTMLFSATMTDNVDKLIRLSLQKPVRVQIDPPKSAARGLTQEFVRVRTNKDEDRTALLAALCKRHFKSKCIIFFRSKAAAHQMKIIFGLLGLRAGELHGNLSQEGRLQALEQFRDGHVDFLMATDLAARGLDVTGIDTVINYTMPTQFPQYLHRIGRTARAGRTGRAITLIGESDRKMLKLAVKNSPKDKIKQRVVPNEALNKYRTKVDELVDQVKDIMAEERQEKMLNDAEMQVTRATNLIQHKDEIKNRPRRTWFQSTKDRKEAKDVADRTYAGKIKSKRSYDKN
ncbi:nucleolar DEAD-box protein required for synthesis of 60S ribosomal subunit [Coemansia sp. RSA 2337]|nr:nucleolar DEAD-box protein required for synthesis of 60S ribosomal subunit [Coemansia sp. S680]KAJ2034675.1 nucleolar DEAD-box protein required for synthesis of 60S ribosomal subunit [Coemansia sp. S3946]KAJ2049880.1 nucleolar DEAD-box protein required for synthesis of 60S ribosomal subunit [Coemansia sp. S2]KAJ2050521.1 nucleolar DEAD-box protein required for synthesis of 60S ribosomal subunit [Coemansia sp. S16]KAJ2073483.1 nucleolar DEAD-box protein required for synthesis of 60S ribosomal